jgi:YD repeat-containing protein
VSQPGQHRSEGHRPDGSTPPGGRSSRIGWLHPRRRAVRLAGAIGVMVGVLCIVLGTLALVVEMGPRSPGKAQPTAQTTSYQRHGNGKLQSVTIPGRGPFKVDWSFSCPHGRTGTFKIAGSRAAVAAANATSGHSRKGTFQDLRAGTRHLFIVSTCAWAVHFPHASPSPSPTPDDAQHHTPPGHKPKNHHRHKEHHGQPNARHPQQGQEGGGDD